MIDERHACVLSVHTVAGNAVVRERLFAVGAYLWRIGQRILMIFVADEDVMFRKHCSLCLQPARRICLAARERCGDERQRNCDREPHRYSTTCSVSVMPP
jgi:hypothetical protein